MTRKRTAQPYQMRNVTTLIDEIERESATTIPIGKICFPQHQPRKYFDSDKMQHLIDSVREHGILEPLLVRPLSEGRYELVAGERRYRAAKEVGLEDIPIVSRDLSDQDAVRIALVENLQREDLNPVEETEAILNLISIELGAGREEVIALLNRAANAKKRDQELTGNVSRQLEQIAEMLSSLGNITPETFRTTRLPLLNLPADVLEALRQGQIEYTKAKAIAQISDVGQRQVLLDKAIEKGLSLSQIRSEVKAARPSNKIPVLKSEFDQVYSKLKKSDVWSDRGKQKQLKELLAEIKLLLEPG
ncbi:MAG: ParB/RepB/Spo0J family partition protein [Cyanobacteria bacterium CAN_BIN43]|nr:ParB/RepB/Spo0J family partition protein [Cyanobacteria bacterium CAN_BIN43]